jgi:hypothetical protein
MNPAATHQAMFDTRTLLVAAVKCNSVPLLGAVGYYNSVPTKSMLD